MKNSISFINTLKIISEQCSEKRAFHINEKDYSYTEFYQKVNKIANELSINGQRKVIVTTNNDLETYASIVAVWLTGNIFIPLNINEDNERLKAVITILDADIVLSSKDVNSNYLSHLNIINTKGLDDTVKPIPTLDIKPTDIAYILFTSGTTGVPKGVPISYQNLAAFVDSFLSLNYLFTSDDVFLQMADLTFDMSIISTLIPLCLGANIITLDNDDIKYLATYKALSEQKISVLITAPSTLQLLDPYYSEINLKDLKYTFVGAEAFYATTANQWQKCAPNSKIINLYGPSEGGILSSTYSWNKKKLQEHNGIVSIGKPVKHIEIYIVDRHHNMVSDNEEGEAWISGKQVFNSYLDESMNEDKFEHLSVNGKNVKCFKTGDIMYKNDDGNLFYCGRKDQQVKIQGKRIELEEIEYYASKVLGKFHPTAISFKSEFENNQIALFIDKNIDVNKLSKQLKEHLPSYMIPTKIIGLDSLPLNKNQKVDKKVLASYLKNN